MANKYESAEVTVIARNMYDAAISPPSDFSIGGYGAALGDKWYTGIFATGNVNSPLSDANIYSAQSNLVVKRLGVFCNFADGLVFKKPEARLNVSISMVAVGQDTPLSGDSITNSLTSRDLTGVATSFSTDLTGEEFIVLGHQVLNIENIDSDTLINTNDYAMNTGTYTPANVIVYTPFLSQELYSTQISVLNQMVEVDRFFNLPNFVTSSDDDLILTCNITHDLNFSGNNSLDFLTKSINTAFDGDTAFFDVYADIEVTPYY